MPERNLLLGGSALIAFLTATACGPLCGNRMLAEAVSPGGQKRAVVFERDCGATTGFSTQISVLDANDATPQDTGNVFIADGDHGRVVMDVQIRWESPDHLVVNFPALARVFRQQTTANGVRVSYEKRASK